MKHPLLHSLRWIPLLLPLSVWAVEVEVSITGLEDVLEQNARAGVTLIQKSKSRDLTLDQIRMLYHRSEQEIQQALQPFGYYHAKVESQIDEQTTPVQVNFDVTLNQQTKIDELDLKLKNHDHNPLLKGLFDDFPLKPEDPFNHQLYEEGKSQALNKVYSEGYLKAYYVRHDVIVDLSNFKADIALTLDTGSQFTLGQVHFEPNYYDQKFLQRFVTFDEVEPYRLSTIAKLEERLIQSGLFDSVLVTPQIPEQGTITPLSVKIKEAAANRYLLGVGYDTNTKSRVRLGWDRKKINRYGHQFKTNLKLSEHDTLIDAHYKMPGKHPWVDNYQLAVGYANEEYKEKPSELYTAEFSETRELWGWNRTLALRYLHERFKDSDFVSEQSQFLLPSLRLSHSKLDDPFDPSNGYRVQLSIRGGIDALVGNHNFIQFYGQYKWLKSLSSQGTLIARTELGFTLPDDIEELPLSIRFYAGGNESLRGFKYRSLPPEEDESGNPRPVGGAHLVLASLEYTHTIWGPIKLATFVDGGGALQDIHDDLQLGAGFGIRWQTPIGPLKLDIAKPLTNAAKVWRVHFSFGPEI